MRSDDCRAVRDSLLDRGLAGGDGPGLTGSAGEHLRRCPGCARYLEGLRAASGRSRPEPLYTPALRRRTLAAVARTDAVRPCWLAPLLVPASALSVAVSVVVPVWILTLVLRSFLGSDWLSLGFAFLLTSSACLASGGLTVALLARQRAGSPAPAPSGAFLLETRHE